MLTETSCEVCQENKWQILGKKIYNDSDAGDWSYGRKRFKVLFDKWFPGKKSIELSSVMCGNCGFIIYLPRPEEKDIDTKYRYLEELGQDYGSKRGYDSTVEKHRSLEIVRYVKKHLHLNKVNRVLDYGGGDGRLMQAFRDLGKECYLVDYNLNCIPGTTKLSDTIDGIPENETFDLIICSHVMEHVAQPLEVTKKLHSHLSKNGSIFIEVPMEVWKKPPLHREPVTHVNFFTQGSTHNLLTQSGLKIVACELKAAPIITTMIPVVKAIGTKSTQVEKTLVPPDAEKLLKPDGFSKFIFYFNILKTFPIKIFRMMKISIFG